MIIITDGKEAGVKNWRLREQTERFLVWFWHRLLFQMKSPPPNSNKELLPVLLWILILFFLTNCQFYSVSQLCQWKWVCSFRQACVNIMYTTHRSIHLVPMKYREWAGHSASLTSLYSAIRLSAIMAHRLSREPFLGQCSKTNRCSSASHRTIWNILNLLMKCELQRRPPTAGLFNFRTLFLWLRIDHLLRLLMLRSKYRGRESNLERQRDTSTIS